MSVYRNDLMLSVPCELLIILGKYVEVNCQLKMQYPENKIKQKGTGKKKKLRLNRGCGHAGYVTVLIT